MKKVLAILMAIMMVVTMFSFSTIAFAEDTVETKPVMKKYAGGTTSSYSYNDGREGKPWGLGYLSEDGMGKRIVAGINKDVESGKYSAYYIYVQGNSSVAITISGIVGTVETPVYIEIKPEMLTTPLFESEKADNKVPAISLENCEYVTLKGISAKSSAHTGIEVKNCKNVTIDSVEFKTVGYTDYSLPESENAETGEVTYSDMDKEHILNKGAALLIGEGNENVTVANCKFENCRAGVVVDCSEAPAIVEDEEENTPATAEEETEETTPVASKGVEIKDCSFTNISDAAILINSTDDVVVSGGSATKVGGLVNAANYDGTPVAVVMVNNSKNVTVEKMYSTFNEAFVYADASTGRIRYNVSDNDGASYVEDGIIVYNNTFVNASSFDLATAKNNIFSMLIGEKVTVANGEANCYHWTSKGDRNSIKKNPWFANKFNGSVEGQPAIDNYKLATGSPCIGAGVQVEDDMGATDFYGNAIGSSHNIGADEGTGAEATYKLVSQFADSFNYFIALIRNFFANLFG